VLGFIAPGTPFPNATGATLSAAGIAARQPFPVSHLSLGDRRTLIGHRGGRAIVARLRCLQHFAA
jgi:hypothetical protein